MDGAKLAIWGYFLIALSGLNDSISEFHTAQF